MVQHPIDLLGGASRAKSCLDPKLKRYAIARATDIARQAFAAALRKWIAGIGETQRALARRIGVSEMSLYSWVHGDASPSPENLDRLRTAGFVPPTEAP